MDMDCLCCVLLMLLIVAMTLERGSSSLIDYTENVELIQQLAGYDVKLQCGLKELKGLIDDKKTDTKIHWYFKQCSESFSSTSNCRKFSDDDWNWEQLPCEQNSCKTDLVLRNLTERYSGLYKCTVIPHSQDMDALDIQLVRTYQLDVKNKSIGVPEFLDAFPLNKSVLVGLPVVFQCRVHSEVHPTIKWFRRTPEPRRSVERSLGLGSDNFNTHIVRYNGRTYKLLSTAREKPLSDATYLSKLILNSVHIEDEGYYACVAISYRGYRIREAFLQVTANDEGDYWAQYEEYSGDKEHTDPKEFWLLFLMPLGLAMLPTTVWLCYVIYKRCKLAVKDDNRKEDIYLQEEIVC